jgi:parallel beta-helix repeat protein
MSGTYAEALIHSIPPGTSWDSPVTVAAAPGHTVTLKPNLGVASVLHFRGPQQYIVIDGLILDATNTTDEVVKITGGLDPSGPAHHIRFIRCEIKNSHGQGILITGFADWNEFIDLNVHDNGTTGYDHGLYITTDHNAVEGSTVYRNVGYGIHIYSEGVGKSANYNTVRNNRSFDNGHLAGGAGILIGSGDGNTAYNNLVYNNARGIRVAYNGAPNSTVYNNTVYGNTDTGLSVRADVSGAVFKNNIVYSNGTDVDDLGAGTVLDHNLVGTDPRFVNAVGGDFHLQPGSSAIDAGITVSSVTTDIAGTLRPQQGGYDIGAFEAIL